MTGRVCEVHGEYAVDGVCRWCEPDETPAQELARVNAGVVGESPGAEALRIATGLEAFEKRLVDGFLRGAYEVPIDVRCALGLPAFMISDVPDCLRAVGTREFTLLLAAHVEAEEARLASEHAALRWERVARRWNWKHRRAGGLDERGRRYVWMHWLDQTARRCP